MGMKEVLIIVLLSIIIGAIIIAICLFFKARGEKKMQSKEVLRTRPPKFISAIFLGLAIIGLVGGISAIIYCCVPVNENIPASEVIAVTIGVVAFSSLGFLGYAIGRFNYLIADNEGILVSRLFRKKRYYRYEEIGYISDTTDQKINGTLTGYSKDGVKIFSIDALYIGASLVAQRLHEHGVKEWQDYKSI